MCGSRGNGRRPAGVGLSCVGAICDTAGAGACWRVSEQRCPGGGYIRAAGAETAVFCPRGKTWLLGDTDEMDVRDSGYNGYWKIGAVGKSYISYTHCAIPFCPGTGVAIAIWMYAGLMAELGIEAIVIDTGLMAELSKEAVVIDTGFTAELGKEAIVVEVLFAHVEFRLAVARGAGGSMAKKLDRAKPSRLNTTLWPSAAS